MGSNGGCVNPGASVVAQIERETKMAKHLKFAPDEVIPRMKSEFERGISDLADLEWKIRDELDVVEALLRG